MNKMYIKITKGFAESSDKMLAKDGLNYFGYGITKDGEYFCDKNSINTHPALMQGNMPIEEIYITADMLPQDDII
jgi:hypothetical protein